MGNIFTHANRQGKNILVGSLSKNKAKVEKRTQNKIIFLNKRILY